MTISHINDGFIGIKKNTTEVTKHITAAQVNAIRFEPTHLVNDGEIPPNIMQVISPNAIKTV